MYYHITTLENAKKILKEGLKANCGGFNSPLSEEGYIYLFENKSYRHPITQEVIAVADAIAKYQLLLDEYIMLEIDERGIDVEVEKDDVGELAAFAEWKVKQPIIDKRYINYFGTYKIK